MNVVLAAHNLAVGGIGTLTRGIASSLPDALPASDHLTLVGYCPQTARRSNVECLCGGRVLDHRLGRHLYEQTRLALAARRADLVHLVEPRPLLGSGTPFALTLHDVFFLDRPEWYPRATGRFKRAMLAAAMAKRPRLIICVSSYTRERFLCHHRPADEVRIEVIHAGLAPASRVEDADDRDPYFLTVSMIEPRKNHLLLLEALRLARHRGLRIRWKVAGAAGYGARPIISALQSEPGVDFLGSVSNEERDQLYRRALFCAFPSHAEGFGFPPLEAMTFGSPVICTTGSALDETVGDAALRLDSKDVHAWADALQMLESDDGERARLAERGRRRAARFTWDEAAARHIDCYRAAFGSAR
jgi:glycosyltransferase involved in cell wall biosynthesis